MRRQMPSYEALLSLQSCLRLFLSLMLQTSRLSTAMSSRSSNALKVLDGLVQDPTKVLLLDGGTGEELFRQGVPDDRKLWSATAVVHEKYHDTLQKVHRSFVQAGSSFVTTNSYAVTPGVGFSEKEIAKYCQHAARLAKEGVHDDALVLGSLPPLVESYRPDLVMEHDQGVAVYARMMRAMQDYVDIWLGETLSSTEEALQVIDALSSQEHQKPLFVSFTVKANGQLRSGEPTPDAVEKLHEDCLSKSVSLRAVLFNCAEPEAITLSLQALVNDETVNNRIMSAHILRGAYANRLTSVPTGWTMASSDGAQPFRQDLGPAAYCQFCQHWRRDLRAQLVGGCCGISPEHIEVLHRSMC